MTPHSPCRLTDRLPSRAARDHRGKAASHGPQAGKPAQAPMPAMYEPTPHDIERHRRLRLAWIANRAEGNFKAADEQRDRMLAAGWKPPSFTSWHPVFETPESRAERLAGNTTNRTESPNGR